LRQTDFHGEQSGVKVSIFLGRHSMRERRESARDKVMYGGVAEIGERGTTRECIVRNISDRGATIEFSDDIQLPKEQLSLRVARKGRSFLAKVIWWRDNFVGVAFRAESPAEPVSDLAERLRRSEIKKRQLERRIDELLGER
jgi:PilZ domain